MSTFVIAGAIVSMMGVMGGLLWTATPEQLILMNRLKKFFGPEPHPLIEQVQINLYVRKADKTHRAISVSDATRSFTRLLEDQKHIVDCSLNSLVKSVDSNGRKYFSSISDYAVLISGEIIIRFKHPLETENIFSVLFTHDTPIHFPLYQKDESPKLRFTRKILQASLGKTETCVDPEDIDVSELVLEYAGPQSDFYDSMRDKVPHVYSMRLFWDMSEEYRYLKLTDSFGGCDIYDLKNELHLKWPRLTCKINDLESK